MISSGTLYFHGRSATAGLAWTQIRAQVFTRRSHDAFEPAAWARIPLTHREHTRTCVLATGRPKHAVLNPNWQALAQPGQAPAEKATRVGAQLVGATTTM
ncbi:MAG TPA: hypothetical protein VNF69_09215 [Burkholderiales bacterium]|nr:hypothetical protein [Burkholderiales bacterium]